MISGQPTTTLSGHALPPTIAALRDRLRETAHEASEGAESRVVAWAGALVSVTDDLAGLETEWRAFEKEADGTAFQTFDWVSKWQRHIGGVGGTRPAIVVGRDAAGAIDFIFPLAIESTGGVRRLTWLGAALCDYNGPMLSRGFTRRIGAAFPPLWRKIVRLLQAEAKFAFDFIDLPKMLSTVGGQPNPFFALDVHPNASGAYVATLGETWDVWYAAVRSGPTRKKERKQLKQLGEHGAVRYVEPAVKADTVATMRTLFEQKSRSFRKLGVRDNFARRGYRDFYLDLTTDPTVSRLVHVSRLDVGETIAAASLGLRFGDQYYLVLSSYQDGELSRFGPGRAHLNELLHHAIDAGMRRFDFTIGDEPYKRDYSDVVVRPHDHLAGVTLRGKAVVGAYLAFRAAKRLIKQTPALWSLYSRLRSLRGGHKPSTAHAGDAE